MKIKLFLILFILMILPIAYAQEIETIEGNISAGTTPDNTLLWGLDRAIERVGLLLIFSASKKVEKRLKNANERLAEVREMINQNKMDKAELAGNSYHKELLDMENYAKTKKLDEKTRNKIKEKLREEIDILEKIKKNQTSIDKKANEILSESKKKINEKNKLNEKSPDQNQYGGKK